MRLLVCGSRDWDDEARVRSEIAILAPDIVMHGNANRADSFAQWWADDMRVNSLAYPADWSRDGKSAGPLRNARMLRDGKPDRGLAFGALWRFDSRARPTGTGDMVRRMLDARLPVRWVAAPDAISVNLDKMPEPT